MDSLRWRIAQWFEKMWWKKYLATKNKQEYLDWKQTYWLDFLNQVNVTIPTGKKILDAGCGPAGIFMILQNNEVSALDPLLPTYENTLSQFNPKDYPWVTFIPTSLEAHSVEQQYDLIFCINAINHVDNLSAAYDQLLNMLTPNGQLIISIDAHNSKVLKKIFQAIPGDILHPHQYDLQEYQQFLTDRKMKIDNTVLIKKENIFNYYAIVARKD
jgi:2-polyprenyl-3-methyl-5-hydroxy-6-metoxy-1,4-benzoquinol methylase